MRGKCKIARIELVRIKGEKETVLEVIEVPESLIPMTVWYPPGHIEKLEEHYRRTGKPKLGGIDVLYLTRLQKERW